jgi:hypothetical protein
VEDVPIGFFARSSTGNQTMMTGRNIVSHELLPPKTSGDSYRAKITVKSDTQYSLQRSTERSSGPDASQSNNASADNSAGDNSDVQIFDPAVASSPSGGEAASNAEKLDPNAVTVAQTEHKYERTYELVYENGQWKLVTELDPNTEEQIKVAFEHALASQS